MRVAVHDYAGHPFQVELSRGLARRGDEVLHLYSGSITTPRGTLTRQPEDPPGFSVEAITLDQDIPRESLFTRWRLEARHGSRVVERLREFRPDVVISGNTPLEAQRRIARYCRRTDTRFVYWVQDLIGEATKRLLPGRLRGVARPIGWYYEDLESRLLWGADRVVVISKDFLPFVPSDAEVIENWAPVESLPVLPKDNEWSARHGLQASTNLLYSGTLGMKHDPHFLLSVAETVRELDDVRVIVVSEGAAADWLRAQASARGLVNVITLAFQPFEDVPKMLASADVLIAVLGREAGVFSVPSKVLTYLCAQRALLVGVPAENLAARIVAHVGAGLVVDPADDGQTREALGRLMKDPVERQAMGARARAYAEQAFASEAIVDRFETVLRGAEKAHGRGAVHRATSSPDRGLTVVIVSYRCLDALEGCLESLEIERQGVDMDVVVVDNASHDGTTEMVAARFPWVSLIESEENVGFSKAVNRAITLSSRPYVLLLNPDTVVRSGTVAPLLAELRRHPDVGVLGCKLVRPDGTFDHACKRGFPTLSSSLYYFLGLNRIWPTSPRFAQYTAGALGEDESGTVDAINGAFMLLRREAIDDVGPMDERYWLYAEDLDWCHRFWGRGWKILYWPAVEVVHRKGGSSGDIRSWHLNRAFHQSMWLFYSKHLAPRHAKLISVVVWTAIWSRFGASTLVNAVRRSPQHAWNHKRAASVATSPAEPLR